MLTGKMAAVFVAFAAVLCWHFWPQSCLCHIPGRLEGKVALVTDCSSFLGREITSELARRGAVIYVGCIDNAQFEGFMNSLLQDYSSEGERVKEDFANPEIREQLKPIQQSQIKFLQVHLNAFQSVRQLAKDVMHATNRLDYLINNAAVDHGRYRVTMDGLESTMGIGYLAHYLLTDLLAPLLRKTKPAARVINVASAEHYSGSFEMYGLFIDRNIFNSVKALSQVKLANVLHSVLLADKFKGTSVIPVSVNPGYVLPNIGFLVPTLFGSFFKTRWEAAQTLLQAILTPDLQPGGYYSQCHLTTPNVEVLNATIVEMIKRESDRLVNINIV